MGALFLALWACSPYEGTWLLFSEVTKSAEASDEGREGQLTAEIHALSDGSYAATFSGITLLGTIEGTELSMDLENGYTYSGPGCDELSASTAYSLDGEISPSSGFDGRLKVVSVQETKACGGNDSESSTTEYAVMGVKLEANDAMHADGAGSASF
jgi:hypothetical protein